VRHCLTTHHGATSPFSSVKVAPDTDHVPLTGVISQRNLHHTVAASAGRVSAVKVHTCDHSRRPSLSSIRASRWLTDSRHCSALVN